MICAACAVYCSRAPEFGGDEYCGLAPDLAKPRANAPFNVSSARNWLARRLIWPLCVSHPPVAIIATRGPSASAPPGWILSRVRV